MSQHVHVIDHPLVAHYLTRIRDRATQPPMFRQMVGQIGSLLAYEATRDLATEPIDIETPMRRARGVRLSKPLVIVPILRAGLGYAESIHRLIPDAIIGHLGMFRDEQTLQPVSYYQNLPKQLKDGPALLVDPMLATGGSAVAAVNVLRDAGCNDVRFICLIAAPEGIAALHKGCGPVPVYTAAVDEKVNEHGYILPGLGDAGDRLFGTT